MDKKRLSKKKKKKPSSASMIIIISHYLYLSLNLFLTLHSLAFFTSSRTTTKSSVLAQAVVVNACLVYIIVVLPSSHLGHYDVAIIVNRTVYDD